MSIEFEDPERQARYLAAKMVLEGRENNSIEYQLEIADFVTEYILTGRHPVIQ